MSDTNTIILTASEVTPGEAFDIYVFVQNNVVPETVIYCQPLLYLDGVISTEGEYRAVPPWSARNSWMSFEMTEYGLMYSPYWKFTRTMGGKQVEIKVDSWIEQEYRDIYWHRDSSSRVVVKVLLPSAEYRSLAVAVS